MDLKETPIFFDKSGRRWRITENVIVLLVTIVGVTSYWIIPKILAPRLPPSLIASQAVATASTSKETAESAPTVEYLTDSVASKNTAVVGSGPLVRLIRVEKVSQDTYANDPFSNQRLQKLSAEDQRFINGDEYAIQKYGSGKGKHLVLTFDDGPDAIYTPQLLDLLSRESVRATFFVTGGSVSKYPEIMNRIIAEGHSIGNHTFTHLNFDLASKFRADQEINQTQRLIVATTNHDTAFFRPPYGGNSDQSFRDSLKSILTAQKLGYTVASFDFDSDDWQFNSGRKPTYPVLDGSDTVVLLHDGGGDRSHTITYVQDLINQAKDKGYAFSSLENLYPFTNADAPQQATNADKAALLLARATLVWPQDFTTGLFIFSLASLIAISLLNILLAILNHKRTTYTPRSKKYSPHVAIIIPSYNEEKVIEKSVRSLIRSRYRKIEIIIVDDGSTDDTMRVAQSLAKRYKRVTALHQANAGKAAALNNGISKSKSEIVICVDADTLFTRETIMHFISHFEDESVGAVAGVVKVGNAHSMLTRWQALEYISGISIERNAQALLGAITIVPGACGAWRRSALIEVGGFSNSTLAEDCDLALKIQKTGNYKIVQDNDAISYTEAPQTLSALTKQRFRWTFGTVQSLWKHRHMVFNEKYGWLGMYVLPSAVLTIAVPIVFWPLLITITIENIVSGNLKVIWVFYLLSIVIQTVISIIGIILAKERYSLLVSVPFARFIYGPIRMYILYKTIDTILKGVDVGWNKLNRTGTAYDPLYAQTSLSIANSKKP